MPRAMSTAMATAVAASNLKPVLFLVLNFASSAVRVWTGIGTVSWGGFSWIGLGSLMAISVIEDGSTIEAKGISITLSGLDTALLADCMGDFQLGLPVVAYFGLYSGSSLIADPITSWSGRMDQPTIDVSGETSTIMINCENRLIDMNVPVDRRYTHEDQQLSHPGDLGFQFVNGLQEITVFWGKFPNNSNNV